MQKESNKMSKPTLQDIINKLNQVLSGQVSREDAAIWAINASHIFEKETSLSDNDISIWKCLDIVSGVDLKDAPYEYLHNEIDIKTWIDDFRDLP